MNNKKHLKSGKLKSVKSTWSVKYNYIWIHKRWVWGTDSHVVPRSIPSSWAMTNFLKGQSWHHENEDVWLQDTRHKFSHWLTNTKTMCLCLFTSYIRVKKAHEQAPKNDHMIWHWEEMCTVHKDDSVSKKKKKKLSLFTPSNSHFDTFS